MAKEQYDWLDDPFDDSKSEQELKEAMRARNMGCLISGVAFVVILIASVAFAIVSFFGILGAGA